MWCNNQEGWRGGSLTILVLYFEILKKNSKKTLSNFRFRVQLCHKFLMLKLYLNLGPLWGSLGLLQQHASSKNYANLDSRFLNITNTSELGRKAFQSHFRNLHVCAIIISSYIISSNSCQTALKDILLKLKYLLCITQFTIYKKGNQFGFHPFLLHFLNAMRVHAHTHRVCMYVCNFVDSMQYASIPLM